MNDARQPWEDETGDDAPSRDIAVFELTTLPGPSGANPVAGAVGEWVRGAIQRLRGWFAKCRGEVLPQNEPVAGRLAGEATTTTIGALEGKLKGHSLEGALKQAEIERTYAEERERNAAAALQNAQAAKLRQDMAFERVERSVELFMKLGVPVNVTILPDGRPAITLGEGLVAELPALAEGGSATVDPPGSPSALAATSEPDQPTTTQDDPAPQ